MAKHFFDDTREKKRHSDSVFDDRRQILTDDTAGTFFTPRTMPQSSLDIGPPGVVEHIGDPALDIGWPGFQGGGGGAPAWTIPKYSNLGVIGSWTGIDNTHGRGNSYVYTTTGRCKVTFSGVWGFSGVNTLAFLAIEPCNDDGSFDMSTKKYVPELGRDYIRYTDVLIAANWYGFHHERIYTIGKNLIGVPIKWGVLVFTNPSNLYINVEGSGAQGQYYFQFFPDDGVSKGWERVKA